MTPLDRRAADLRAVVQEIVKQFQAVNAAAACGPIAELNMQELRVVEFLGAEGPRMMREIADFLGVAVNTVTAIVDGLEANKHVCRQRSADDRRVIRVDLTDTGRATYRTSTEVNLRFMRTILGVLTEDEQETFLALFRKIARAGRSEVRHLSAAEERG